jgi:hypothetical protein
MDRGIYGSFPSIGHPEYYNFPERWTEVGLSQNRFATSVKKVQSWLNHRYSPVDFPPSPIASVDGSLSDEGTVVECVRSELSPIPKVTYLNSTATVPLKWVEAQQPIRTGEPCSQPDKEELRFNMKLRQLREQQNTDQVTPQRPVKRKGKICMQTIDFWFCLKRMFAFSSFHR